MTARISQLWLSRQSDERLVMLARTGDDRAFEAIVERYQHELYAVARRRDRAGRAEDVVQQTFMSAFTALRSGTEVRHLRGWLHQILRRSATPAPGGQVGAGHAPSPAVLGASAQEMAELRMRVTSAIKAISELPSRQQQALVESALNGRSRAEVAGVMGLSEGAVRQLLHRARTALRGMATALMPYPVLRSVAMRAAPPPDRFEIGAAWAAPGPAGSLVKIGGLMTAAAIGAGLTASSAPRDLATRHAHHHPLAVYAGAVRTLPHRAPTLQATLAAPSPQAAPLRPATSAASAPARPVALKPVSRAPRVHGAGKSRPPASSSGVSGGSPAMAGGASSRSPGESSTPGADTLTPTPDGGNSNLPPPSDSSTRPAVTTGESSTAPSGSDGLTASGDGAAVGSS